MVAILAIAVLAGGAAVRIGALAGDERAIVVVSFAIGVALVAGVVAARSRPRLDTPYW